MTITIIGTPDSGKSKKAEDIVCELSEKTERYYIATMIPYGDTGKERVQKHRRLREGKGFITIEQPFDLKEALSKIEDGKTKTVLLECVSNLAANEMFERQCPDIKRVKNKIAEDVKCIQDAVKHLVIVSNHFPDDPAFDEETREYTQLMDEVNQELEKLSDQCIRIG